MLVQRVRVSVFTILLAAGLAPAIGAQAPAAGGKTLYERIGGYDTIAKVVDSFLPKLAAADPRVPNMVSGLAATSRMRNRQLIIDQICSLSGGPCVYIGRSMEQAHQGLQITDDLWQKSQKAMAETLDANNIHEPEKSEFLAMIDKLKADIIQKKAASQK